MRLIANRYSLIMTTHPLGTDRFCAAISKGLFPPCPGRFLDDLEAVSDDQQFEAVLRAAREATRLGPR